MREFEGRVTYAPYQTERSGKLCNISTRVDVGVSTVSTLANETMFRPFSDFPAYRARLASIRGGNITHGQPSTLRLVLYKGLQLPKSPSMQPRPDSLPGLDIGADVGQIFHSDFACARPDCFCNDGLADFVVDCFDMPCFTTGDSAELAFSSPATVGLETTTMGKVFVAVVPQLTAAPDLASTGGREVVLANIKPESSATSYGWNIGNVEDEIEIPDAFAKNQFRFLRCAAGEKVKLMPAGRKWNALAATKSKQRDGVAFDRVGALIKVHGRGIEANRRNRLVFDNSFISFERLVSIGNAVNRLAYHLATQCRKLFAHGVIGQVMQGNAVPAAMFHGKWSDGVAGGGKCISQGRQRSRLLGGCQQLQGYGTLVHIGLI